jgi:RNA polymerase sigma-70 factor (ECF subfamily)
LPCRSRGRMDDLGHIAAFRKGDSAAFEPLLARYKDRIYNLCRYLLHDPRDAEDAAQDIFLKAFRGLKGFSPSASFYTWLYRIAVNTCLDQRRKAFLRAETFVSGENYLPDAFAGPGPSPESAYETRESIDALQTALSRLSAKLRIPLVLKEVEGLAYEEIAATLDVSLGTVKSRISRAREEMATMVAAHILQQKAVLNRQQQGEFFDLIQRAVSARGAGPISANCE